MFPGPAPDNQYLYLPHPLKSPSPSKERGRVFRERFHLSLTLHFVSFAVSRR